jgi:anti-sigma factor RsiW
MTGRNAPPDRPEAEMHRKSLPADADASRLRRASRWMVRAFPWHLRAFLVANFALTAVNVFAGGYWWGFWPLAATGFALGVHYLFYKAVAADERWVDERIEELNLKSYDRSHIEGLKERYSAKDTPEDGRG